MVIFVRNVFSCIPNSFHIHFVFSWKRLWMSMVLNGCEYMKVVFELRISMVLLQSRHLLKDFNFLKKLQNKDQAFKNERSLILKNCLHIFLTIFSHFLKMKISMVSHGTHSHKWDLGLPRKKSSYSIQITLLPKCFQIFWSFFFCLIPIYAKDIFS